MTRVICVSCGTALPRWPYYVEHTRDSEADAFCSWECADKERPFGTKRHYAEAPPKSVTPEQQREIERDQRAAGRCAGCDFGEPYRHSPRVCSTPGHCLGCVMGRPAGSGHSPRCTLSDATP